MVEKAPQPQLFPDTTTAVDTSAIADAIAANAPSNPYAEQDARKAAITELRGEDLQADQIGRPVEPSQGQIKNPPITEVVRRPFEMPGRNRGRSNTFNPTRKETLRGMTPEAIARQAQANRGGAAVARLALQQAKSPED